MEFSGDKTEDTPFFLSFFTDPETRTSRMVNSPLVPVCGGGWKFSFNIFVVCLLFYVWLLVDICVPIGYTSISPFRRVPSTRDLTLDHGRTCWRGRTKIATLIRPHKTNRHECNHIFRKNFTSWLYYDRTANVDYISIHSYSGLTPGGLKKKRKKKEKFPFIHFPSLDVLISFVSNTPSERFIGFPVLVSLR